jgi:hypothetical protein
MSVVLGHYNGEKAHGYADEMALTRVTTTEARRARAMEMAILKRRGVPAKVLARKYRLELSYVYQEIKSIPGWQLERLDEIGLDGLQRALLSAG